MERNAVNEAQPLHVLLLNNIGGESWGGIEKWMLLLAEHLRASGHTVAAAAKPDSRFAGACRQSGLPTAEVAMRGDFHPADLRALRRLYREHDVDLVVLKHHQCIRMAWAAGALGLRPRPALLCRLGDAVVKGGLRARLTYRFLCDRYVTPSEHCRTELLRTGYFRAERIRAIPNGVDLPPEDPTARGRLRDELGLGEAPTLIVTSRLHPMKGHAHLLDAVALLREDFPALRLLVVGDGVERGRLEEQAEELGLADAVVFTGFRTDVAELLRAADLFVLPSLREGMPNTALEAMAAGLPVVAAAVDGVPEVVVEEETGLLVPARDPQALRDAIGRLLTEPQFAQALGQAGRERVAEHFSTERMLAEAEAWCLATRDSRR
jgi:glycosyltransferase involved in cell wall biosynthesis